MTTSKKSTSSEITCKVCSKEIHSLAEMHNVKGVILCSECHDRAKEPEPTKQPERVMPTIRTGSELKGMDIVLEWIVFNLIPKQAVCLLYGRGGIGKTTLIMMLADAIDRALAIFGMDTVKTTVIIVDFENSLAVLSERAKRTGVDGVLFIDSSSNPPHLDKPDWTVYLDLLEQYPGALFVFDTLRSSHSGDENDSRTMSLIMSRMRQLRDAGATVVLLHHTPKGNDRQFKGSGAIFDLCDQTLALYQTAKPGSEQEADDDDDSPDKVYRFGTGKKTRYKPHRIFLSFDTEKEVFTLAKNPDDDALECLHSLITDMSIIGCAKQSEIVKRASEDGGYDFGGDKKIISLLKKGIGRFWTSEKGLHNSIIYRPIQFGSLADPIGSEKLPNWNNSVKTATCSSTIENTSAKLPNREKPSVQFGKTAEKQTYSNHPSTIEDAEFVSLAGGVCQTAKLEDDSLIDALYGDEVPL